MTHPTAKIGAIVLAAGASSRLGQPKQLLRWQGRSLIEHAATVACESWCDRVIIVVGANADVIATELRNLPIEIIHNPAWQSGMSYSLRSGLTRLGSFANIDAAMIMLCDQPLITSQIINQLIQTYTQTSSPIVACQYGEIIGVPALFDRSIWPALQQLEGDTGARKIIQQYRDRVTPIACPTAAIDIDTPAAWEAFQRSVS